ncbi:MAG: glycosyl hydrolase family 28 protein [Planctomycetota bacterium]|nr:glycosyl hydrolase family 28 protein [Planctomycetota bacterium]
MSRRLTWFLLALCACRATDSAPSSALLDVRGFGAVGDGQHLDSPALQRAIDAAFERGGGTVHVPHGDYRCGTLELKSGVTLWLDAGATLWGSTNLGDYDPQHNHLIWAESARNIAIVGQGAIDGQGPRFWDGGRLERWLAGEIDLPRTQDMLRFDGCEDLVFEDIDVRYGAFWNMGFRGCQRITLRALTLLNGLYDEDGPNTDGINLWSCSKVQISDCDIRTGDDCIVVLGDSRDVTITNCKLTTSETALMISGVRNLVFSNSTTHDAGCGIGFRVWSGIVVDGVRIDNIVMDVSDDFDTGGQAIYLWSFPEYVEVPWDFSTPLPPAGVVRNVTISNVTGRVNGGIFVTGFRERAGWIQSLTLENIRLFMNGGKDKSVLNPNPPDDPYPIYGFHGAPYAMYLRYVEDLELKGVHFTWNTPEEADWGAALRCFHVGDLVLDGFVGRQSAGSEQAAVWLRHVDRALVRDCRAPEGTGTFLHLDEGTGDVSLIGNELSRAAAVSMGIDPTFSAGNRLPE